MKKKVLIIHTGIPQLITQLGYIYQNNLLEDVYGVVRIYSTLDSHHPELDEAEQWFFDLFNIKLIGKIKPTVRVWGENKYEKLLSLFFLKKKIKKYHKKNTDIDFKGTTDVVIPYKPMIDFVLLLSIFKNVKFHFITEGASLCFYKTLKLPFYLYAFGIKNIFNNSDLIINSPLKLQTLMQKFGKTKLIQEEYITEVFKKVNTNTQVLSWLKENQLLLSGITVSILFVQPLFMLASAESNIEFYNQILMAEKKKCSNKIIVKFHPRETNDNIEKFRKKISNYGDVIFFTNSFLSYLPIELYFSKTNINRIIGFFSTALYIGKNDNNIETSMYYSNIYPDSTNKIALEIANDLNIKLEEIKVNN